MENFTSDLGIRLRRRINRPLRFLVKYTMKRRIIVESYPRLDPAKPYIFASTHSFDEDIIAGLAGIDRNAYLLLGSPHQIEGNPQAYAGWLNGMIYVNRRNAKSRRDSVKKMERILKAGSSVLLFPEGGWNNTENLLVNPLFAGPYLLAKTTGAQIVPICTFCEHGGKTIWFNAAEPISAEERSQEAVLGELRDSLATMVFESMEKHATPHGKKEGEEDFRERFMKERCREYLRARWRADCWEEELTVYRHHSKPELVWTSFDDVVLTKENAAVILPIRERAQGIHRYDLLNYMQKSWREEQEQCLKKAR